MQRFATTKCIKNSQSYKDASVCKQQIFSSTLTLKQCGYFLMQLSLWPKIMFILVYYEI